MAFNGLAGKVGLVTGAGSGIGAAVAARLAAEGVRVVAVDSDGAAAARVAGSLGGEALAVTADVSREDEVERYMEAAVARFGRVELYHLNAGISGPLSPLPDVSVDDFDRVMGVNARGVFLGMRAAFRQLARQGGGGAIVTMSSLAGFRGGADLIPYHASKHAVTGLTRCAAVYGGPLGIRVNAVAPGIVPTNLLTAARDAAGGSGDAGSRALVTPLGRAADPAEIAAVVAFLLSDDAAYVSGGVHTADGGTAAINPFRPPPRP
jgi:NAD(P)-dependent dehydrogenase (short-subunit alcohol dehydrogenase family)